MNIRIRMAVIAASAIVVVLAAATVHVIPFGRAYWDYLFVLSGAYRISLGQVPHVDFMSPFGPLTLYLGRLAEVLFPAGQPFVGVHALMWLLLLPAFWVLTPRLEGRLAFFGAFAILVLMTLVPFTIDPSHVSNISYFGLYNRFSSALLFLLGLWYVLPKRRFDAALLAYILILLFFLKVTAALAGIVLLLCAAVLGRTTFRTVGLAGAGVVAVCILIDLPTGLVVGYLRDLATMAVINEDSLLFRLAQAGYRFWAPLAVCAAFVAYEFWLDWGSRPRTLTGFRDTVAVFWREDSFLVDAAILVAMALAVESQNTGGTGLISATALLFHPAAFSKRGHRFVGTVILGVALLLPMVDLSFQRTVRTALRDTAGTTEHGFSALTPGIYVNYSTLEAARLMRRMYHDWMPLVRDVRKAGSTFEFDPANTSLPASVAWAEDVVDAADVFREKNYGQYANQYAVLSFADPFTRYLGLSPAKEVELVVDHGRTVSVPDKAEASRYLAPADGVFVPHCDPIPRDESLKKGFDDALKAEFRPLPLNACWTFYARERAPEAPNLPTSELPQ